MTEKEREALEWMRVDLGLLRQALDADDPKVQIRNRITAIIRAARELATGEQQPARPAEQMNKGTRQRIR